MSQREYPGDGVTTITVEADGPLEITGALRMVDARTGEVSESDRVFLCRCGHSARKPFCDGSHRKQGFADSGNPGLTKPSA